MTNRFTVCLLAVAFCGQADAQHAEKNLYFVGDFESGRIKSADATHDGFYVATLPDPQSHGEFLHNGQSDFGETSKSDTKVVRSEVVGGETVRPRKGEFFMRSEVSYEKDYLVMNNNIKNRPCSKIYMSNDVHQVDFDKEGYVGFSIYTPRNVESELGVRDHRGESMLFVMSTDSSRTLVTIGQWVESPATEAHWFLKTWTSSESVNEAGSRGEQIDMGPVREDAGKWTDFVMRYRFNPFSTPTNPAAKGIAGSKNQMFDANKGILQVWKAKGAVDAEGNRGMALMVDKVNTPVGLVPHAQQKIRHLWRIYKYGWHSNPTTLTHPVWFGFDEIRQGLVERDGTTFAEVAPAGNGCASECGEAPAEKPKPPTSIAVN